MTDQSNYPELEFYYARKNRNDVNCSRELHVALLNDEGFAYWTDLEPEEREELLRRVVDEFDSLPVGGGSENFRNVFRIYRSYPDGRITDGRWWNAHTTPETWYGKHIGKPTFTVDEQGLLDALNEFSVSKLRGKER